MEAKFNRRIIVSIGGVAVAIGIVVGLYMFGVRPKTKEWNEVRVKLKEREKKLNQLRNLFSNQDNPTVELRTLKQEIKNLQDANAAFDKIKKPGVETKDLPVELKDPDPQIRLELFRDYIEEVMSVAEENIKRDMKSAGISPPDIKLYAQLNDPGEASYYMNRAGGLQGLTNAIIKTQSGSNDNIILAKLALEDYNTGIERRSTAGNVLSYFLDMTMDMQNLMAFIYNLQEEDGYYFVEEMTIKPARRGRFGGENPKLLIDARINTVMIYKSEVMKAIEKATKESAKTKMGGGTARGGYGRLELLAMGYKKTLERQERRAREKKWYEFWK